MKQRIVEKKNNRGESKFYPQYRKFGIWRYYYETLSPFNKLYADTPQKIECVTIDNARQFLTIHRHTPKTIIHSHPC